MLVSFIGLLAPKWISPLVHHSFLSQVCLFLFINPYTFPRNTVGNHRSSRCPSMLGCRDTSTLSMICNFFIISPNNCWEYTKIRSANRLLCLRNSLQINAIGNIIITVNCERHSFGQWQRYPSVPYQKVIKQLIPIFYKPIWNLREK